MKTFDHSLRLSSRSSLAQFASLALGCSAILCARTTVTAQPTERSDIITYPQVSEAACPVEVLSIPGKAGNKVTAVVRKPMGPGPFPAIVLLHGGLSPYPVEKLKDEALRRPN